MYDGQKIMSNCPLIPDASSAEQHIYIQRVTNEMK